MIKLIVANSYKNSANIGIKWDEINMFRIPFSQDKIVNHKFLNPKIL